MASPLPTEFEFTLPLGYMDAAGQLHRRGVMRRATARDEIEPLGDPRVVQNEAFFGLLLLSRVVRRIGPVAPITPNVVANLYAADFAFLQALYAEINAAPRVDPPEPVMHHAPSVELPGGVIETRCPQCDMELVLDLADATPHLPVAP